MAQRKETIWQVDFSLGSVRPEAVERDDIALVEKSLREATNTATLSTGQVEGRPGLAYLNDVTASIGREVDLGAGRIFDLHIVPNGVILYDASGAVVFSDLSRPWTGLSGVWGSFVFADLKFWVISDPDTSSVLIGSQHTPIQGLSVAGGTWAYGSFLFATGLAGEKLQPYWEYDAGILISPSARTGAITVTASAPLWTAAHIGMSIRYLSREITLTGFVSSTVMNGTVIEELPPTYRITVASASGYKLGDAVEHKILGGQGIVTGISGTNITVLATSSYDGFDAVATPKLVGPNAAQVISAVVQIAPAATFLWDMQMLSKVHGYPGCAAKHKGRTFLGAFPGAPLAFASSGVADISDFSMGVNDDDGFAESLSADRGGALKFIVSAEDLLFFTSKGIYYQQTRSGEPITPKTINPTGFSTLGCADVEPAVVEDGCIFADAVGGQIFAALLGGDVYRSWRAVPMAKYHNHVPANPVRISATSSGSETPEQFVYVLRGDGNLAVCQWDRDETAISWRVWNTVGTFQSVYQCFGSVLAIVDRMISGVARRTRERFTLDAVMDCSAWVQRTDAFPQGQAGLVVNGWTGAFATHLTGHTATVYMAGWDLGDNPVGAAGKPLDGAGNVLPYPDYDGMVQVGLPFQIAIVPWARRSSRTQSGTREVKRLIQMFITVQATGVFSVDGIAHGGYRAGENLSIPPLPRDTQIKVPILGRVAYETVNIVRQRPGMFRLLKLGYRVVI